MNRRILLFYAVGAVMLALSACSQPAPNDLPTPFANDPEAEQTALAASRPTLPPTFTPSATWTAAATVTATERVTLTPTLTLTITLPPSPTFTRTPQPSPTSTWTPDTAIRITPSNTATEVGPTATPFLGCVIPQNSTNLLQNAGFEGASFTQLSDIQIPNGWVGFWVSDGIPIPWDLENTDGFRRPKITPITKDAPYDNPPRVYAGNQALYISGGNRAYDAGIYQQVTGVTANDRFCLSGFGHAWSAHQNDDPTKSTLETPQDIQNLNFQLGIDPTGGTNAYAGSVIWGPVGNLYDKYAQIPSVQVRAEGDTITVFVRGWARWRFDHNDMFFDEIKLIKNG